MSNYEIDDVYILQGDKQGGDHILDNEGTIELILTQDFEFILYVTYSKDSPPIPYKVHNIQVNKHLCYATYCDVIDLCGGGRVTITKRLIVED